MAEVYGPFRINDGDEFIHIRKNPDQEYIRLYAASGEITDEEMALAHKIAAVDELLEACIDSKQAMNNILEFGLLKEAQSERELLSFITQSAKAIAKAEGKS